MKYFFTVDYLSYYFYWKNIFFVVLKFHCVMTKIVF